MSSQHFVYIIRAASGPVKIGITNDLVRRLSTLQTAHYEKLTLFYTLACADEQQAYILEQALHAKYEANRLLGEWFSVTPDDVLADLRFAAEIGGFIGSVTVQKYGEKETVSLLKIAASKQVASRATGEAADAQTIERDGMYTKICPHCNESFEGLTLRQSTNKLVAHLKYHRNEERINGNHS